MASFSRLVLLKVTFVSEIRREFKKIITEKPPTHGLLFLKKRNNKKISIDKYKCVCNADKRRAKGLSAPGAAKKKRKRKRKNRKITTTTKKKKRRRRRFHTRPAGNIQTTHRSVVMNRLLARGRHTHTRRRGVATPSFPFPPPSFSYKPSGDFYWFGFRPRVRGVGGGGSEGGCGPPDPGPHR